MFEERELTQEELAALPTEEVSMEDVSGMSEVTPLPFEVEEPNPIPPHPTPPCNCGQQGN